MKAGFHEPIDFAKSLICMDFHKGQNAGLSFMNLGFVR